MAKVLRFRIFADNLDLIEKWNLFNRSSGVTLGINEFSDLTHAEFTRSDLNDRLPYL